MVIFHSYVSLPEGTFDQLISTNLAAGPLRVDSTSPRSTCAMIAMEIHEIQFFTLRYLAAHSTNPKEVISLVIKWDN